MTTFLLTRYLMYVYISVCVWIVVSLNTNMCYLTSNHSFSNSFLMQMNIVDTPGTNVILERQQRLTEEFVPRADLLLFVISADRPLTESEA